MGFLDKLFGSRSQREIKKLQPIVDKIIALEDSYRQLSEEELKGKTAEFKNRYAAGESLDDLLPEAFAAIREASDRVIGLRPYPVQLLGGIVVTDSVSIQGYQPFKLLVNQIKARHILLSNACN